MDPDAKSLKLNQLLWQVPLICLFLKKAFFLKKDLKDYAELAYLVILHISK